MYDICALDREIHHISFQSGEDRFNDLISASSKYINVTEKMWGI